MTIIRPRMREKPIPTIIMKKKG